MTSKTIITLIIGVVALTSNSLQAQDYTLSHLTDDTSLASISGGDFTPKAVEIGQLPSNYLNPSETDAMLESRHVASASHGAANLAVLVGFAALLALGGTITSLCVFARRKQGRVTPINMVSA
jgi:hypothetical protein